MSNNSTVSQFQVILKINGFANLHPSVPIKKKRLEFDHLVINVMNRKMEIGAYFDLPSNGDKIRHVVKAVDEKIDHTLPKILTPIFLQHAKFPYKYIVVYNITIINEKTINKIEALTFYFPYRAIELSDFRFITRNNKMNEDYEEVVYNPISFTFISESKNLV